MFTISHLPNIIASFYFTYILYYGLQNQKIRTFLYDAFLSFDMFVNNRDLLDNNYEDEEDAVEEPLTTEKKPLRYEDKYLEQYTKLDSIELTKEILDGLKNTMIMESTPIGNVIMFYDSQTENFVYYSDVTMPYRYLEVIGRKYVIAFKCKNVFIDMNQELKLAEEKKPKHTTDVEKDKKVETSTNANKKDVFAKFKTYNNNVTKEVVAAPSKNAGIVDMKKESDAILLKEKANRYRYEGKLANLSFLQQVDKKQIDKRLAMSWKDYKKVSATR
jgi:hypothetical protein